MLDVKQLLLLVFQRKRQHIQLQWPVLAPIKALAQVIKFPVHLRSVLLSNNVQEEVGCLSVVYLQLCLAGKKCQKYLYAAELGDASKHTSLNRKMSVKVHIVSVVGMSLTVN